MLAVQFAMRGEALPFLARGTFERVAEASPLGFELHRGSLPGGSPIVAAIAGTHPRFGVDAIGSVPAALLSHTLIERFRPSRLINAGTAGGFAKRGGEIGDVYLGADTAVFHDRRVPLPGFDAMGPGHFPVDCDRSLAARLGLKVGIVSTGDSLDCSEEDARQLSRHEASVKEMEAAAIGWVCERHGVPLVLLKAITDIVDHPSATQDQFIANYAMAITRLADTLVKIVHYYDSP